MINTSENLELFDIKLSLIKEIHSHQLTESFSCIYHGIPFCFKSNNKNLELKLREILPSNWFTSKQENEIVVQIFSPLSFDIPIGQWQDEPSQDCIILDDNSIAIQRDFAAIELSPTEINLITDDDLSDGVHNFFRWYLPKKLLSMNSFVLHSSCIIHNNKAHFFLGHSGAGKSTISSLSGDRPILGDDMNLIINKENNFIAKAGALGGLFFQNATHNQEFEIAGFYWLNQSDTTRITRLDAHVAQTKILASITNLFWDTLTSREIEDIIQTVATITTRYPSFQLDFTKSQDFWSLIDEQ